MIGEKIKELRTIKKITQEDLANYLGVAPQTVYKYEKGINEPDLSTTNKIAEFFDVTTDYLIGRTNEPNTIKEIDKKLKENNIHIAANSKVDLAKLARADEKTAKLINTILDDFIDDYSDNK